MASVASLSQDFKSISYQGSPNSRKRARSTEDSGSGIENKLSGTDLPIYALGISTLTSPSRVRTLGLKSSPSDKKASASAAIENSSSDKGFSLSTTRFSDLSIASLAPAYRGSSDSFTSLSSSSYMAGSSSISQSLDGSAAATGAGIEETALANDAAIYSIGVDRLVSPKKSRIQSSALSTEFVAASEDLAAHAVIGSPVRSSSHSASYSYGAPSSPLARRDLGLFAHASGFNSPAKESFMSSSSSLGSPERQVHAGAGAPWAEATRSGSPVRRSFIRSSKTPGSAAPQKPSKQISYELSEFHKKALAICSNPIIVKSETEQFLLSSILDAKGQHSQIYTLRGPSNYYETIPNENLIVKVYQQEVLEKSSSKVIMDFVSTSLQQYHELLEAKLPITKIYNSSTVLTDGFFVVERVTPLDLPWNESTSENDIKENHMELLLQMKTFFDFAKKSKSQIPLDISATNFGINREGRLVLLDFMEHKEDDLDFSIPGAAFKLIKKDCLSKVSAGNAFVIGFLDS